MLDLHCKQAGRQTQAGGGCGFRTQPCALAQILIYGDIRYFMANSIGKIFKHTGSVTRSKSRYSLLHTLNTAQQITVHLACMRWHMTCAQLNIGADLSGLIWTRLTQCPFSQFHFGIQAAELLCCELEFALCISLPVQRIINLCQ
ncbi:MAG: hypothetical protein ACOYNW_09545 [Undibacterium curvum]|uniref:hypothetical protein n=1 Tax=Undibacterium curvum TaxID=2762294 RepID=UPI003BE86C3F